MIVSKDLEVNDTLDEEGDLEFDLRAGDYFWLSKQEAVKLVAHLTNVFELSEEKP